MEDFLEINTMFLLRELAKKCIKLTEDANKLTLFTECPNDNVKKHGDVYYWPYEGNLIPFELLSEKDLLNFDKKFLLDGHLRNKYETYRALRIAGSHLLPGAIYQLVVSDSIKSLVIFKRDNKEYIIDYANNLIMKKDDYIEMFPYKVVEEIEQADLIYVNEFYKNDNSIPIELILAFWGEVKKSLQERISTFAPKYELSGINERNNFVLNSANETETLFWLESDYYSSFVDDVNFIFQFTLNPLNIRIDVSKDEDGYYHHKDYSFRMLSEYVKMDKLSKQLLNEKRYGQCFDMSIKLLFALSFQFAPDRLRIVLAKTAVNSEEDFYHAWAEFKSTDDDEWYAADYTGNIIEKSDEYIRLRKAKVINMIPYDKFDSLYEYLEIWAPCLSKFTVLYFGEEMLRDFEKNKFLFKGMQ